MARGRMLGKSISTNRRFWALSCDQVRLLLLLMLPAMDGVGRMQGDAPFVRIKCMPKAEGVTDALVDGWLSELHESGLLQRWEDDEGGCHVQLVGWKKIGSWCEQRKDIGSRRPDGTLPTDHPDPPTPANGTEPAPEPGPPAAETDIRAQLAQVSANVARKLAMEGGPR